MNFKVLRIFFVSRPTSVIIVLCPLFPSNTERRFTRTVCIYVQTQSQVEHLPRRRHARFNENIGTHAKPKAVTGLTDFVPGTV